MKTLQRMLILLAAAGSTVGGYGQGTVNFDTLTLETIAQVYDDPAHGGYLLGATNYGPGAQGTNWFAQLYAAAGTGVPSSALVPVGQPVNFRSGFNAGYVQVSGTTSLGFVLTPSPGPVVTIPFLSPGGPATVQLRVWWGGGTQITSYEVAVASSNPNTHWGASPLLHLAASGDPTASPPAIPVNLIGLLGFHIGEIQPARPPVITTHPQSEVAFVGANVSFAVAATGSLPMSYQWSFNGTSISGANAALLALANVQPADAGSYAVRISNADGSVTSSNAVLTVIPAPPCAAPPSGLVSWWRGETNADDTVGDNHGTPKNGVTLSLGKVGHAFDFNGLNQYLELSNSSSLNPTGSFSIEGWIYPRIDGWQYLFSKWSNDGGYADNLSYALRIGLNRALHFAISDAAHQSDSAFHSFEVTNVLTLNAWSHVAAVYDQATGTRRIHVNGVLVGAKTNWPITVLNSVAPVWIGANYFTSTTTAYHFNGLIDELSFYSEALSGNDIQAIYAAGSVGKCKEPPAIVSHPVRLRVNEGMDAQFNVVATGNPMLRYQWFKDGVPLAGETSTSLTLTNVQDTQAGAYSVQVTNWFGGVASSNALLTVNHPPVADASATRPLVISPNRSNATVVLNGSRSSDPDGDSLRYFWYETSTTDAFATGMVAVVTLPLGTNPITLVVDDGLATGAQTIAVEVITPAQAVARLRAWLSARVSKAQPLVPSLLAAIASMERGNPIAASHQLQAFQNKVRAQVAPTDPALAEELILAAQTIMDILGDSSGREQVKFTAIHREGNGKTRLHFNAKRGPVYIIEVSTNLVGWEKIGVAADDGNGLFEFEDANATRPPARFYRVVSP